METAAQTDEGQVQATGDCSKSSDNGAPAKIMERGENPKMPESKSKRSNQNCNKSGVKIHYFPGSKRNGSNSEAA